MAITTYSELQTAVANWLDRTDLTTRIPDFITLAEVWLNRNLRIMPMEARYSYTATASTAYLQLPTRFLGMRSVRVDGDNIDYLPPTLLDANGEYSGNTTYYTIENNELRYIPPLANGQVVEVIAYQGIAALSDSNTSNWFLANAPDALLYATLMQAEPYIKNDERLIIWGSALRSIIDQIESADKQDRYGSNLRIRPA